MLGSEAAALAFFESDHLKFLLPATPDLNYISNMILGLDDDSMQLTVTQS